ncbi:MAG: hypothetical protein K6U11_12180 [bacterium]|nr:hypothetical protein [bacterium]
MPIVRLYRLQAIPSLFALCLGGRADGSVACAWGAGQNVDFVAAGQFYYRLHLGGRADGPVPVACGLRLGGRAGGPVSLPGQKFFAWLRFSAQRLLSRSKAP